MKERQKIMSLANMKELSEQSVQLHIDDTKSDTRCYWYGDFLR